MKKEYLIFSLVFLASIILYTSFASAYVIVYPSCSIITTATVSPQNVHPGDKITINGNFYVRVNEGNFYPISNLYKINIFFDKKAIKTIYTNQLIPYYPMKYSYTYQIPDNTLEGYHRISIVVSSNDCTSAIFHTTVNVSKKTSEKKSSSHTSLSYEIIRCPEKYLDEYRCYGNWVQRLYQNILCFNEWKSYEYCPGGCENGTCINNCEESVIYSKCNGNYLEEKIQLKNCTVKNVTKYCKNGCYEGKCLFKATKPLIKIKNKYELYPGETKIISFTIENDGPTSDFKINVSGNASKWVEIPNKITVNGGENKTVMGVINVPSKVSGKFLLTISVIGNGEIIESTITLSIENKYKEFYHYSIPVTSIIVGIILFAFWKNNLSMILEESFEKDPRLV